MPNYNNTIIYKICCKDELVPEIYIGHTTIWKERKSLHKRCCVDDTKAHHNYKIYTFINANGGWENWEMTEIEKYPCNSYNEACIRERYWYDLLKPQLNSNQPVTTKEERKASRVIYLRKWRANMSDEQKKEYAEKNSESQKTRKDYFKKYYQNLSEEQRETILQRQREMRANMTPEKREEMLAKRKEYNHRRRNISQVTNIDG